MNTQKSILQKRTCMFFLLGAWALCTQLSAQNTGFPFFRSFLDGRTEHIAFPGPGEGGDPNRENAATLTNKGLRLTSLSYQVGAFFMPDHSFTTNDGMLIEFEYMMYGSDELTDGICMFLVDKNTGDNLKFGAEGAGFGYTYNWSVDYYNSKKRRGIQESYLAVALDQGNFKTLRFIGEELRNGIAYWAVGGGEIHPSRNVTDTKETAHDTRSNITIRGAAGTEEKSILVQGRDINREPYSTTYHMAAGYWGSPVLATRHTGWDPTNKLKDPNDLRNNAGYMLNPQTGLFDQAVTPRIETPFNIAGGAEFERPDEPEYRKAIITLEPNPNTMQGGFRITVKIQHGLHKTTVIENFTYSKEITYLENGLPLFVYNNYPQPDVTTSTVSYTAAPPEQLVIGFAASTGLSNYTNVIKNLRITPFYGARAENDEVHNHRRGPVTLRPLDNDLAYKKEGDQITESKDFLDPDSFRFWTNEETCIGDGVFECDDPQGRGKWVFDPVVQEAMFFPARGFSGKVSILYDIQGAEPVYDNGKFRSSLATISIEIDNNQPN